MQTKHCSKCLQTKDICHFPRAKQNSDGFHRWCKACSNAQSKQRYEAKREEVIARTRQWQADNPEKFREHLLRYQQRHPDQKRSYNRRANAKQKGATLTTLDHLEWAEILARYGGKCAYCQHPGDPTNPIQQDHVIPLKGSGQHTKDNVIPACRKCNRAKSNKTMAEFLLTRQQP